jgi:hypothetical protein
MKSMATKTNDAALRAAELQVQKMRSMAFAAASSVLRLLFDFEQAIANDPKRSADERKASLGIYNRGRAILLVAPIETPADAIAALRYVYEWHEQGHDTYTALHERAIDFLERHVAAETRAP